MSAQEPPALRYEVWRCPDGSMVVAIDPAYPETPQAWLWTVNDRSLSRAKGLIEVVILGAWAMSLRARVTDLERDLAEYRAADRAGKDTV